MRKRTILSALLATLWASAAFAQQSLPGLDLQRVIDTYIQNNLEIQTARYKLERTRADQIAARLRPNPSIAVTAENLPVSGPTPFGRLYEIGTTYTETIELGGKKAQREKTANATVSAAELQFEDTMRRGLAEVKRLYLEALLARYHVELATEGRQTFEQLLQFNQTRFQEGAIPEVDLIKVRLERVKFDSSVKHAELGLWQAEIRLLEKMGLPFFLRQTISGDLTRRLVDFDLGSLNQVALAERSDIRAATAEVTAANERLALERARAKPDISPFAGYKRVGNDNTLLVGVNIPLKVRDRNEAEIARAELDVKAAEVRLQITRNHAQAEVGAAFAAFQTSRDLVDMFESGLLAQADESRSITLAAYEEGGTELLPVFDAQRTRTEVRSQYFKTLFDYQASVVALQLAVGKDIQP